MKYRSRTEIVAMILEAANGGATKTKIMYKAFLSYAQLKEYLSVLIENDFPAGTSISWTSSNAAVVTTGGAVTRPALGQPNATVTLTATVTKGKATATKSFTVTVLAAQS